MAKTSLHTHTAVTHLPGVSLALLFIINYGAKIVVFGLTVLLYSDKIIINQIWKSRICIILAFCQSLALSAGQCTVTKSDLFKIDASDQWCL